MSETEGSIEQEIAEIFVADVSAVRNRLALEAEHQRLRDAVVEAAKARWLKEQADGFGYFDSDTVRLVNAEYEAVEALLKFEEHQPKV